MSLFFLICSWLHNILIQGKYQTSYIFEITYGCSINNDTENSWLLTFSRFTGSLNAESMTSLVGTIFHFGMISSTCVRRVITTGCGFTFSDICSFADNPHFSNPQQKVYIHGSSLWYSTLHIGATRTAPSQKVGSFLCSNRATAPPMDSPYKNRLLFL